MKNILNQQLWGNTIQDYLLALLVMLAIIGAVRLFRSIALHRLKKLSEKTDTVLDDLVVKLLEKSVLPLLNVLAFYAASQFIALSPKAEKYFSMGIAIVLTFLLIRLITSGIQQALNAFLEKQGNGEEKKKQVRSLLLIAKILIWLIGALFLFDNLGFDVTAIITGLGIGGIAIALAAQTILGDLFSYFVIFFDRPFEIGDMIVVDDKRGTVEHIGLKTTRIRSLTGEQLVISNTNLTNSRLHNFKKLEKRRVLATLGVTYNTSAQNLKHIPGIIKDIVETQPHTIFDRVHFATFGAYSLNFELVYFVDSDDYQVYMDTQQNINLSIFESFANEGIEFAFPTQYLYVESQQKKPATP